VVAVLATLTLVTISLAGCAQPAALRATSGAGGSPTVPITTVPITTVPNAPAFVGVVARLSAVDLPSSWRPGCPVGPEDLRLLRLSYFGFDAAAHEGSLIVHASVAGEVMSTFRRLFEQRFPIRRMDPVDMYGGSDEASTAADNTSGFNCRNAVSIGAPHLSAHAFGRAIDVNPVENPYILGGEVLPPAGASYGDRSVARGGMAVSGGVLTEAFAAIGWSWGGKWASPDYQHFSETGN